MVFDTAGTLVHTVAADPVASDWGGVFLPDKRWIAYTSDQSGDYQVYVRRIPPDGTLLQVSSAPGSEEPRWSRDGRRLYFRNGRRIMADSFSPDPTPSAGTPAVVFEGDFVNGGGASYDVAPDGRRFLVIRDDQSTTTQLRIVTDWFSDVRRAFETRR
jgi:Tol biopolymer transport system component